MFSGIVEAIGIVTGLVKADSLSDGGEAGQVARDGVRLELSSELFAPEFVRDVLSRAYHKVGDSICVSGVCLTIVAYDPSARKAVFELASETLRASALGGLKVDDKVNLEPSLCLGDSLHGHLLSGHVDAVGRVRSLEREDENTMKLVVEYPLGLSKYIAAKGSIGISGVSLTVGEVRDDYFSVYLIPHTCAVTTLGALVAGDKVNLEVDLIARYVVRALEVGRSAVERGIDVE